MFQSAFVDCTSVLSSLIERKQLMSKQQADGVAVRIVSHSCALPMGQKLEEGEEGEAEV